ncbi:hypothetical protein AB0L05_27860 [Nonomuraea pusilla]|uniref:hypothetical protein n=1 Tax=Nonomuraea pusilla TaxID=46177 RepID=UPI00332B66B4
MTEHNPLDLRESLIAELGEQTAQRALDTVANWARSQAAVSEHGHGNQPEADKHNARIYRQVAKMMDRYGAAPPPDNLSDLAAAVWTTLADGGHTAAIDSPTGDGYQISHTPGAVLVTLVRGDGLYGLPWAATQAQTMNRWAATLATAGYPVDVIGDPEIPHALRVTRAERRPSPPRT